MKHLLNKPTSVIVEEPQDGTVLSTVSEGSSSSVVYTRYEDDELFKVGELIELQKD